MCGRFTLTVDKEIIKDRFLVDNMDELFYEPNFNIAPSQNVLAIIHDDTKNKAGYLKWGLVPSWASDESIGYKMINARAETVAEKPSFKKLLSRRRCLIVADSFFEWKKIDKDKQPYRFLLKTKEPFAFAGLWDRCIINKKVITTCTIITTTPNKVVEHVHNRMPVILKKEDEAVWLNRAIQDPNRLSQLLLPYFSDEMMSYQVSSLVNSPKNNQIECIQPIF